MDIAKLFESKSKQLFWRPIAASHLIGVPAPRPIEPGNTYFVVRLCEMYLATARKLWHQIYPMLHCYVTCGSVDAHGIASPAQLKDLGDANLDRLANLNTRLCGPIPYRGEEVSILAGLYAIPGHDAAKALTEVVSSFASLSPTAIGRGLKISGLVKNGVESLLGLDQATLHLGVRDTFNGQTHPLTSGYFVGVGAAEQSIDASQLWIVNGRLSKGKDAASATPYTDHDYLVLAIERLESREDWPQLAEVQDYHKKFSAIATDTQFSATEKRTRLAALWPAFVQMLADSAELAGPDRERISTTVASDLLDRLKLQDMNPFLH